jgi:lipopolysaccharide/colanic/teichoic acid biosynthesis glycosyltransferase
MEAREDDLLRSAAPVRRGGAGLHAPFVGFTGLLADLTAVCGAVAFLGWALPEATGALTWHAVGAATCMLVVGLGHVMRCYARVMLLSPRPANLVLVGVAPAVALALLSATGSASVPAWPLAGLAVLVPAAMLTVREALALALAAACRADLLRRDRVAIVAASREAGGLLARGLRAEPDCSAVDIVPAAAVLEGEWGPGNVDRVVVQAAGLSAATIDALRGSLRDWPGPVDFVGSPPTVPTAFPHADERGRLPVFARKRAPLSRAERAMKRGMDVLVSATALLLLSPLLVTVALLMLATRGQALVRLRRDDFRGRPLGVYAFPAGQGIGLGEALQRTSLAQLPALLNVLKGDLSLVGPAPLHSRASPALRQVAAHAARQGLRPGLAQPATPWRDRVAAPTGGSTTVLAYCDEWSLGLDLVVLAGAVGELCTPEHRAWA